MKKRIIFATGNENKMKESWQMIPVWKLIIWTKLLEFIQQDLQAKILLMI